MSNWVYVDGHKYNLDRLKGSKSDMDIATLEDIGHWIESVFVVRAGVLVVTQSNWVDSHGRRRGRGAHFADQLEIANLALKHCCNSENKERLLAFIPEGEYES